MRFCSACGASLEWRVPDGDERDRRVCPACGTVHYENPKIVVGAVCTAGDRVLICRRAIEPRAGFWTIPAGYMELHETAEEGARREAWEEARARIELQGLIAVYSVPRISQVQLLYRARLLDEAVSPGPESMEVKLLAWTEIPWRELAFPTVEWVLRRASMLHGTHDPVVTVGNPPTETADMRRQAGPSAI
jgi:ADP-ribose pyrophosphatase YjhB (NUDIX family)